MPEGAMEVSNPIVHTGYGQIEGRETDGVRVWKGIPYARPPVGELRFCAPERPANWEGIRDGGKYSPICPQPGSDFGAVETGEEAPFQSEDCLYLNVWVPVSEAAAEPVLPEP